MKQASVPVALFAALISPLILPLPAAAQYRERVQIIYGDEKCPTSNGQEIVVCARLPENERYRIPKELRDGVDITGAGTWAEKAKSLEYVGSNGGINSCSPVGPAGGNGCMRQVLEKARAEKGETGSLLKF